MRTTDAAGMQGEVQYTFAVTGPDVQNILRLSYDNAKVMIDFRRASNLPNILRRTQDFSLVRFTRKTVRSFETVFAN